MRHDRAVLWVSAVTAAMWPAAAAYSADPAPAAVQSASSPALQLRVPTAAPATQVSAPATESPAASASAAAPGAPALPLQNRASLKFESDPTAFYSLPRHENHHYGMASGSAPTSALNITSSAATRAGWQFSGRVGPVRWLTPLDGEGETRMRFGGRVPGQPRLPGLGNFNVSVHYAFE